MKQPQKNLTVKRTNHQILTFIRKKNQTSKKVSGNKLRIELLKISGNNSWNDVNRY